MAFPAATLLLGLTLFAFYVHQGEALKCWVCSSDMNRDCDDPFNTTQRKYTLTDCERERGLSSYSMNSLAVCRKFKHTANGIPVIVRSCAYTMDRPEEGPCSVYSLPQNTQINYCGVCNTDECNSANSVYASTLISLSIALILPKFIC